MITSVLYCPHMQYFIYRHKKLFHIGIKSFATIYLDPLIIRELRNGRRELV